MNEKSVTLELVTDPVANERARAYDRRLKRNLDWLNARWDDLLPGAHGRYVGVAGQEVFLADTYQEAEDLARAAHPEDDALWVQHVPGANENFLTFDIETDPEQLARIHAQNRRAKGNSDWLQAHWGDLLPQARGKFLAVAGQEAFVADTHAEAWSMARAAHPDDDGALSQYVLPNRRTTIPSFRQSRWSALILRKTDGISMMSAPLLTKCLICRQRAVSPTTLASYATEMEHDGRKYTISVADFQILQCQNCGDILLDQAADERLSDALRAAAGLLSPTEIREKREGLGLTREQLASLLRIPEFTLSLWEAGGQIQQGSMDAFLRVIFQSAEARRILDTQDVEWLGTSDHLNVPAGTPTVG